MVQYRSFKVGLAETASERLNSFLRQNTVISVDKQFVAAGAESFYVFLVEYDAASPETKYDRSEKVDYVKVLDERQFACFSELREYRAKVAKEQGVPPYVVFTNEMAAQMVRIKEPSKAAIERIDGFGDAKSTKYGSTILAILVRHIHTENKSAQNGQPLQ